MESSSPGHIHIQGEKIPVQFLDIDIEELLYLPSNPRVKKLLPLDYANLLPTEQQEKVEELLKKQSSVLNLMDRVVEAGGLNEPIFVRTDNQVVVEGNSRLCVYRLLYQEALHSQHGDPAKWKTIPCKVVEKLTPEQQWAFLHETHVEGKTPWAAYEKANVSYTMVREEGRSPEETAKILKIKVTEVKKQVKVIDLMTENNEPKRERFSYYEQLVRNTVISNEFNENAEFKETILSLINVGNDNKNEFTAQQMRDKLKPIIQKPKELRRFIKNKDLEEAYSRARVDNEVSRLKSLRQTLREVDKDDFSGLKDEDLRAAYYEISKMPNEIARISNFMGDILKTRNIIP